MQKLKLQLPIFRYSLIFEQIQEIWETVHAMRGGGVSFPHFWWKNHLSRSELILKTHHNHSLPRSKREPASFYRGRIVPASIDRKLVNNDDVPHGVAVDIFGPKKTIKWSQLWRNWVQEFLKDHFWFSYFPHSTRNLSGIYSVMKNDDGLHSVSIDIFKPTSIDWVKSTLAQWSDMISE